MLGRSDTVFPDCHWKATLYLGPKSRAPDLNDLGMLERSHLSQMRSFE